MYFFKNLFRKKNPTNILASEIAIPVFCYHGANISGTEYGANDHIAMEEDLRYLEHHHYRLLSPQALATALRDRNDTLLQGKLACITFDDGTSFDYVDQPHSAAGLVKSFHHLLSETPLSTSKVGDGSLSVAFVIASSAARLQLDQTCMFGQDQINDAWWAECASKGITGIGNHSWDHTHETLDTVCQADNIKGSFHAITTYADADRQIRRAQDYLDAVTAGQATPLFAYPYGHASDYLVNEYFPNYEKEHRQLAAFGTGGEPVTRGSALWALPRYVCGEHWRSPEEFKKILLDLGDRS